MHNNNIKQEGIGKKEGMEEKKDEKLEREKWKGNQMKGKNRYTYIAIDGDKRKM